MARGAAGQSKNTGLKSCESVVQIVGRIPGAAATSKEHHSDESLLANVQMNDQSGIRLENLQTMKKRPTELARAIGRSSAYCSDLLRGNKPFGEKAARAIEEALDLPRGWLDRAHVGQEKSPQTQVETQHLSPEALELALQFDSLVSRTGRAQAFAACVAAILRAAP